jgi:hypothetical protein
LESGDVYNAQRPERINECQKKLPLHYAGWEKPT